MTKYKILYEYSLIKLENEVSEFLLLGWKPQGGVFVQNRVYYQAIVK